jgi:Family of unknown function (DUF6600)
MKLNVLLVFASVLITASVMGITGCAVTVQPTSQPGPYYQSSPGPTEGDVSYFYDQLLPYGEWFQLQNYGWVWTPHDVPLGWRPYTDGTWIYTDYGWTWVSDWEWGWVLSIMVAGFLTPIMAGFGFLAEIGHLPGLPGIMEMVGLVGPLSPRVLTGEPELTSMHTLGRIRGALWKKGSCLNETFGTTSYSQLVI